MIIATGTGRCGTGTFSKVFNAHHEYNIVSLSRHISPGNYINPFAEKRERQKIIDEHLKDVVLNTFRDSSNPYIYFLEELYEIDYEIKVIYLVRHVESFCVSAITRGYHNKPRYNIWSMRPIPEEEGFEEWESYNEIQRTAWMWNYRNTIGFRNLRKIPQENYRIVKVEEFYDRIREISEFLGVEPDHNFVRTKKIHNANPGNTFLAPDFWTEDMHKFAMDIAGETMHKFGYDYGQKKQTRGRRYGEITSFRRPLIPEVSIGLPTYNGEKFLEQSIESILNQDFENFELNISDNGSTDKTSEICRYYEQKDPRVRYYRFPVNLGADRNYIRAFMLSSGQYFMWASDDDLHKPNFISRCLSVLKEDPSAVICYPKTHYIDENADPWHEEPTDYVKADHESPKERFLSVLWHLNLCNAFYGLIRTEAIHKINRWPSHKTIGWDVIILQALSLQGKFIQIPDRLFVRRLYKSRKQKHPIEQFYGNIISHPLEKYEGTTLPTCEYAFEFFDTIRYSDLSEDDKAELIQEVLRSFRTRPWHSEKIRFELNRVIQLIQKGDFRTSWNGRSYTQGHEITEQLYTAELLSRLENARFVFPDFPGLESAYEACLEKMGCRPQVIRSQRSYSADTYGNAKENFDCSIIIVTHNSSKDIGMCLRSINGHCRLFKEIVIVDNHSSDETQRYISNQKNLKIITNTENRGFARAINQGIEASNGKYLVFMHPDTVVTPGWDEKLMSYFKQGVGAVGPLSDAVVSIQQKAERYIREPIEQEVEINYLADKMYQWNRQRSVETKLLSNFCIMMPRIVIENVGMLDEDLSFGFDSYEYCLRLRMNGYKLLVATDTFIHHKGRRESGESDTKQFREKNRDILYSKLAKKYGMKSIPTIKELWGVESL